MLLDTLIGYSSQKNRGLEAFIAFQKADYLYKVQKANTIRAVFRAQQELVDLKKKTFRDNSFFLKEESIDRLAIIKGAVPIYK